MSQVRRTAGLHAAGCRGRPGCDDKLPHKVPFKVKEQRRQKGEAVATQHSLQQYTVRLPVQPGKSPCARRHTHMCVLTTFHHRPHTRGDNPNIHPRSDRKVNRSVFREFNVTEWRRLAATFTMKSKYHKCGLSGRNQSRVPSALM